jgi:hypothetical protein
MEIIGVILLLFIYFLPWILAGENHPQKEAIFILNFFLGWTLLGWVICLAMAVNKPADNVKKKD